MAQDRCCVHSIMYTVHTARKIESSQQRDTGCHIYRHLFNLLKKMMIVLLLFHALTPLDRSKEPGGLSVQSRTRGKQERL